MADAGRQLEVLHQYLATRRRIREIERKAMAKLEPGALATGPFCSFCQAAGSEVAYFVEAPNDVRICSLCVQQITSVLGDAATR